jgi:hypothetical protein
MGGGVVTLWSRRRPVAPRKALSRLIRHCSGGSVSGKLAPWFIAVAAATSTTVTAAPASADAVIDPAPSPLTSTYSVRSTARPVMQRSRWAALVRFIAASTGIP